MASKLSVDVIGITWAGYTSAYSYSLDSREMPPDDATDEQRAALAQAVKRRAGDFQSVTDFRIVRDTTTHKPLDNGFESCSRHEVLRDFENANSEDVFISTLN